MNYLDDHELMIEAQNGNTKAFDEVFNRYYPKVKAYLKRNFKFDGEAEDLVQSTFMRLYRHLNDYDNSLGKVSTWIFTIAKNLAKNEIRNRRRCPIKYSFDNFMDDDKKKSFIDCLYDDEREHLFGFEFLDFPVLERIVNKLDTLHRLPLVYHYYYSQTYEEISEMLGIPMGTVKSRISRARKKIKRSLPANFAN